MVYDLFMTVTVQMLSIEAMSSVSRIKRRNAHDDNDEKK